jgi:hypothetical protein
MRKNQLAAFARSQTKGLASQAWCLENNGSRGNEAKKQSLRLKKHGPGQKYARHISSQVVHPTAHDGLTPKHIDHPCPVSDMDDLCALGWSQD